MNVKKKVRQKQPKKSLALMGNKNALGFKHTAESRENMSRSKRGIPMSKAQRKKAVMRPGTSLFQGRTHSDATKAKMSAAHQAMPRIDCPICGESFSTKGYHRWHKGKCGLNENKV